VSSIAIQTPLQPITVGHDYFMSHFNGDLIESVADMGLELMQVDDR
jgi:hypothetical protein